MIGECPKCGELFGGLGLTTSEVCPSCDSLVLMEDPDTELRPYTIHIMNNDTLAIMATYETWQLTTDENLSPGQKHPIITIQFPVEEPINGNGKKVTSD